MDAFSDHPAFDASAAVVLWYRWSVASVSTDADFHSSHEPSGLGRAPAAP